ncbi:hypothetical protein B5S28_g4229 [[Candida] boidinii]|nr:hypothetical protein B5S28_g4229 [[Candida] boidinii]OWB59352.1 hypothetical protein B5S29_g208 [[Candida] boidinii]OWB72467.1 hypothetical protein B5S31_g2179 [[Candida] boidinii]OWB77522.1 hypothetical protein B5S32_g1690 [[Candida] boidinii]
MVSLSKVVLTSIAFGQSMVSAAGKNQWYPLVDEEEGVQRLTTEYSKGQKIPLSCISRQIDNGEHKFDSNGNIMYSEFPRCLETGEPLTFQYGVNEDIKCSVKLTDELYHLFQLYVHEDAPFSCRLPIIPRQEYYVPLSLSFRGHVAESHIDIDPALNIINVLPENGFGSIISSVGWSSGTNTTRIVIGDTLPIQLAIRWLESANVVTDVESKDQVKGYGEYYPSGFYKLPNVIGGYSLFSLIIFCFSTLIISVSIVILVLYNRMNKKIIKELGYRPGASGNELGLNKSD